MLVDKPELKNLWFKLFKLLELKDGEIWLWF